MTFKVAVLDDWLGVAAACADWPRLDGRAELSFFGEPIPAERAAAMLEPFDAIVPMRERMSFPRALLEKLPRLKLIALTGYFAPFVDTDCCAERGIVLCGSGNYTPFATAELTFALILAAMRQIPDADRAIRTGDFQNGLALGGVLAGRTLGIVGLGRIGSQVAKYARAFEMSVIAWSSNLTEAAAQEAGARAVEKHELFRGSDIVSLHLKYGPRSHHVVGPAEIGAMKPGALLVNTARSGLVEMNALVEALRSRRIRAALDVFDAEPLPAGSPILTVPGTVLSPHLGFSTDEAFRTFYAECLENIEAFISGSPIRILPQ